MVILSYNQTPIHGVILLTTYSLQELQEPQELGLAKLVTLGPQLQSQCPADCRNSINDDLLH